MKIRAKDFRVRPGAKVKLKEWPTHVASGSKSKQQSHKLLKAHVEELSALQDHRETPAGIEIDSQPTLTAWPYAQGLALLTVASTKFKYHLDLVAVARIWRGGCIIRAAVLDDIGAAFHARAALPNLLLDPSLSRQVVAHQEALRRVVCQAAEVGVPTPGLMVSLGYLDAYRSPWLPANLIQAQRDYFGAHTDERTDAKGEFHTDWELERE